jgi:glycosyltransferase involved in cell wall biosynthesis
MRVLLVGKGAPERGGIPSFLQLLLGSDLGQSHDLMFLNLATAGTREGAQLTLGNLQRTAADAVRVWRAARHADVVHLHSAGAPLVTLLRAGVLCVAGRLAGCRVLLHAHGGRIALWATSTARRRVARLALRAATVVIAVSEDARATLADALGTDRVVRIDNGVDLDRFSPREQGAAGGPPQVLYVGLLSPRKGVLDLIEASRRLTERDIRHDLVLVGGTPDEGPAGEAEVRAAAAAAGPHVTLLGQEPFEAMPALYRRADVFCLPSWWEAMPLSVLEAMASGVAVVATRVGDVPRLLDDGRAGILVPPRDPAALSDAVAEVLTDVPSRVSTARAGRDRAVAQFSASATIAAIDALYRGERPLR